MQLIPAIIVVLLGGGIIWYLANNQREKTIDENLNGNDEIENDLKFLEDNDRRVSDMEKMLQVLAAYELENGAYPSASQVDCFFPLYNSQMYFFGNLP